MDSTEGNICPGMGTTLTNTGTSITDAPTLLTHQREFADRRIRYTEINILRSRNYEWEQLGKRDGTFSSFMVIDCGLITFRMHLTETRN